MHYPSCWKQETDQYLARFGIFFHFCSFVVRTEIETDGCYDSLAGRHLWLKPMRATTSPRRGFLLFLLPQSNTTLPEWYLAGGGRHVVPATVASFAAENAPNCTISRLCSFGEENPLWRSVPAGTVAAAGRGLEDEYHAVVCYVIHGRMSSFFLHRPCHSPASQCGDMTRE